VFSNFMPDHLNYYSDMQSYFEDKAFLFRHQKAGDSLFIGESLTQLVGEARPPVPAVVPPKIPSDWQLQVPGEHNRENAALAAAALRVLAISDADIRAGLESYAGIEGRLQFVKDIASVHIINDNNATTPAATLAALATTQAEKTVLIMGGADKGLEMGELVAAAKRCKGVVLLKGTGTERIKNGLPGAAVVESLTQAMEVARELTVAGDTILFSPAFASFGVFKNEYDRNDQFLNVISAL
ncbi:MAG TPA: cyanophycin synthetase, partial [Pyrinomonadaceae bacterium]|nr:cyanophycin synthetase [Pyrinomonadaceae bacterium]